MKTLTLQQLPSGDDRTIVHVLNRDELVAKVMNVEHSEVCEMEAHFNPTLQAYFETRSVHDVMEFCTAVLNAVRKGLSSFEYKFLFN